MLPWLWDCWRVPAHAAAPAARAVKRAWVARPRVHHHVVGRVARKAPHVAAVAGKGVAGVAVATGTTLVCARLPAAVPPGPALAAPSGIALAMPQAGAYAPAPAVAWGYPGLPGYLGLGGGVLWPAWIGGPVPGDTTGAPPPVGDTNEVPPFVSLTPAVPPGVGPGAVPPGVAATAPHVPPEGPRDVPEAPALAVVLAGLAGLAALAAARRARRCR